MSNPYSRFAAVANTVAAVSAAAIIAALTLTLTDAVKAALPADGPALMMGLGALIVAMVAFWFAMTEAIIPMFFRITPIRRLVLSKYYIEGTWIQAERSEQGRRIAVIDIQPAGRKFIFSGYAVNDHLEIETNTLIEFSRFDWPFMTYKYRNSLSDGSDGQRDGVGEIQFEMNREAPLGYNGFIQFVKSPARTRIEGAKLTSNKEVRSLRRLEGRQKVFEKYWKLYFMKSASSLRAQPFRAPGPGHAPVAAPVSTTTSIVPRRRAEDWQRSAGQTGRGRYIDDLEATGSDD